MGKGSPKSSSKTRLVVKKQVIFSKGIGGAENHVKMLRHHFDTSSTERGGSKINHTHLPRADLYGFYRRVVHRERWVTTIHGHYGKWKLRKFMPFMFKVWNKADRIIAISEEVKRWLVEKGVDEEKVRVIRYGVEIPVLSMESMRQAAQTTPYTIGTIGRLESRKGLDLLIRAMVPVLNHFKKGVRLKIVGRQVDEYGDYLKELVKDNYLQHHVEFLGEVSHEKIGEFLSGLSVYAQASREEGLGLAVLEAMSMGVPIVVSDIPAFREVVPFWQRLHSHSHFQWGLIRVLRSSEEFRVERGKALRKHVKENFGVGNMVKKVGKVYEEVCAERGVRF